MEFSVGTSLVIFTIFVCKRAITCLDDAMFRDAVNSSDYVDKTNFIKYFHALDGPAYVTAPRWFGKTLAISTLRAFYDIDANTGSNSSKTLSPNYKAFSTLAGRPKLNESVFEDRSFFNSHFASRPVLSLSFNQLSVSSKEDLLASLETLIRTVYMKHEYVLNSKKLTAHDHKMFKLYSDTTRNKTESDLLTAGQTLTGILFRYFSKQCLVLVDDFDAPALLFLTIPNVAGKHLDIAVFDVLDKFTGALLKNNDALFKALLVGRTGLARQYLTKAGNVHFLSFAQQSEVARFFAFTEQEVKQIHAKDLPITSLWNGGFRARDTRNENDTLFNPSSVMRRRNSHELEVFSWWATNLIHKVTIEWAMCRSSGIWKLVENAHARGGAVVGAEAKYDIMALFDLLSKEDGETLSDKERDIFAYYFWDLGIFTFLKSVGTEIMLIVPNFEVRKHLSEIFMRNRHAKSFD
ncbi:unnamed protein product [Bemisia tabaci]|uniref:AAA-ATPase-like domain-containing protein n=1 Tax=Bemisia tabaci TaxID=7038 RepID=A0A9P0AEZ0_BEMTA|nr:unnamed protein product [Bemisia tabaci]